MGRNPQSSVSLSPSILTIMPERSKPDPTTSLLLIVAPVSWSNLKSTTSPILTVLPLTFRLLRGRPDGIFVNPFEIGAIGPELFRAACSMGLEGLVSKRSDRPYRGGKSPHWVKVKNRAHPAMVRVMESFR